MDYYIYLFESASPTVFGEKHLAGSVFIVLIITALLILFLKVLKNVNTEKVLKITAIFLLCLELCKYGYTMTTEFLSSGVWRFPTYYIPMQLCSFSLYLMPIVAFGKGKIRAFFEPTCFSVGLLAGLIVLFYPVTVLGGDIDWFPLSNNIIPIISFVYHGTMIFFSLYLLFSKTFRPELKDYPRCYLTLLTFAGMAMVTNAIFGTDMMFLNTAAGNPLQFILIKNGRAVYMAVMALAAILLLFLPFVPSFISNFVVSQKNRKKSTESI
jgi:uncharacterized membrane protein YwaF